MKITMSLAFVTALILRGLTLASEMRHVMNIHRFQSDGIRQDSAAVRLTVVYDNNPLVVGLQTAWGFACLAEVGTTTLLFDTGGDGKILLENMQKLKIQPEHVDLVVISHIHQDHLGGLNAFLKKNSRLLVYIPKSFPPAVSSDIETAGAKVSRVGSHQELRPNIFTLGEFQGSIKEQALAIRTSQGLVVITGCAHPGILNIVRKTKEVFPDEPIYLVMGGFHLGGLHAAEISKIVQSFKELGVQKVAPCHCSGETARMLFKTAYGKNFIEMGVGGKVEIPAVADEAIQKGQ
jgi:7,8-dihydropterin-6-yl-methyl-4-(beta-D-ribofuranosyl)aminobenzene 5'-phosphate synthase